jgi:hypothetical protein
MPVGIGYSGVVAKSDTARTQQTLARAEQESVTQGRDQRLPEPVSRKNNPAAEVKLSNEVARPEAGVQPRQDVDTYEALNRKS